MSTNLSNKKGTISACLNKHVDEIWACVNNVPLMRQTVLKLLDSPEITEKLGVVKAKEHLSKCSNSSFLSTLTTYLMGEKL